MKNVLIGILAAAAVLTVGAGISSAASPGRGRSFSAGHHINCRYADTNNCVCGRNYTDSDGDGICENYTFRCAGGVNRFHRYCR